MKEGREAIRFLRILFLTLALSSITFIEPSPYDALLICLFFIAILHSFFLFRTSLVLPFLLLFVFLESNLISMYGARDLSRAITYSLITLYLAISWIGFAGLAARFKKKLLDVVFQGYTIAALFAVLAGLLALAKFVPFQQELIMEGRMKAMFKDPNVFGAFLVPPALYALLKTETDQKHRNLSPKWLIIFLLLTIGVLLSFSRAAWGQLLLASSVYFFLLKVKRQRRVASFFMILCIVIPVVTYISTSTEIAELFQSRLGLQAYDKTRFDKQGEALETVLAYPLGIGPGQSELVFNHSTHSLYVRLLTENGLFGFLSCLGFFFICIYQAVVNVFSNRGDEEVRGFHVVIAASLIGILFNSFFIDTIHWRHFWLLLALVWGHQVEGVHVRGRVLK